MVWKILCTWLQIEEKVSRGLVSKLRSSSEFKDIEKKQMILQLLGAKFVEKHLKDEPYVPNILVSNNDIDTVGPALFDYL